jgi:beta-phosphoglucomutase-like phosphatase (HAD superfamily)
MFSALLFDMDGLIFDTEQLYKTSWQFAAQEMGLELTDSFYQSFIGIQDHECEQMLVKLYDHNFDLNAYRSIRDAHFHKARSGGIAFKPGFHRLFQLATEKGLRKALVTSSGLADTQFNFAHSTYLEQFDTIITAEDVVKGKPEPDCYLLSCQKLNLEPSRCLVLEDSNNGVRAGKRAGCTVAMIPDMTPQDPYSQQSADYLFESLEDVSALLNCL